MAETAWFYLDRENNTLGPLTFRDMEVLLRTNEIELSTYAWNESMESWQHIGQIAEFITSIAEFDMEQALHMKPSEISNLVQNDSEKQTSELKKAKQKKLQAKHKRQKIKKLSKWYKPKLNTNLYISGLPKTITIEAIKEFFSKAGVIRLDKFTGAPKIKVYQDESGQCKGDALVSYMNSESLSLAVTMLDKQEIEKGHIIHLEPAEFFQKGEYKARKRVEVNKVELIQAKAKQEELTGWTDDTKGLRIVIISGLFNLDSFSERLSERLRDLLETRIGEVERVKIFRFNPMGVAEVKFKKHSNAEKCIKEFNEKEILEKIVRCEYWDGRTDYRRVSAV